MLNGKVTIITGAACGIGKSISELFSSEGAIVVLCDIDEDGIRKALEEISRKAGIKTITFKVDVSDKKDIHEIVNRVVSEFGRIDVLVNNAAIQILSPLADMREEDWDKIFEVNVKGPFLFSQAVARVMMKQKSGKIINIASDSGIMPFENEGAYCASKSAVIGLTRVLALELRPYNITCNAICPGLVNTQMYRDFVKYLVDYKKKIDEVFERNITQKVADPIEVAKVALFFASYLSDHVTGEHLLATGGDVMSQ